MRWPEVRARYLFREVKERGYDLPLASVTRHGGVEFRSDLDIEVWNPSGNTSQYKRAKPGDFVIGLRSFQSGIGYSTLEGLVSPAYTVLRPVSPQVCGTFFKHLFKSDIYISRLENVAQGIRQGRTISTEDFYSIPIAVPTVAEQRAIADYLDIETGRIDALISKKHRMIKVLQERGRALRDAWFENLSSEYGLVSLRRWWSRIEQGWSPVCDSEPAKGSEWGVIKTSAVSTGTFMAENNKRLPEETEPDMRWRVQDGDLLVTRGSGSKSRVGRTSVADVGARNLTLSDLVYRIHLGRADPVYVAMAMSASPIRAQIEGSVRTDVGQTLKVRRDDIADVRLPAVSFGRQPVEASYLMTRMSSLNGARLLIQRQIELLIERRQALITAMVTGESG